METQRNIREKFMRCLRFVFVRKLPVDRHKALPNGNSKKKQNSKDNNDKYWIKQDQMEPCPFLTTEESLASTIPRYLRKILCSIADSKFDGKCFKRTVPAENFRRS